MMKLPSLGEVREAWSTDFFASIVVFLVALPLCMGIAIASGLPPAAGLITGIVGGLVVGSIAGSPLQVSGPAAGLTVLVYEIVQTHGVAMLGAIVLVGGLIQVGAGMLGLGRWFRAISPAVVQGMLAGIGILIMLSQLHVMVDDKPRANGIANFLALPEAFTKGVAPLDGTVHHLAAAIGIATILTIVAWQWVPKSWQKVPAPLVGIAVGSTLTGLFKLPIQHVNMPDNLWAAVTLPSFASFDGIFQGAFIASAVTVAIVASAETMLTAAAADRLHNGVRTDYDKELRAQGIGNAICGALGALPMTGVIVRTSANIQAGAKTRLSTVLHGAWIAMAVLALPWLLERIPLTALAALLVFTGAKLVSPKAIKELKAYGNSEVAIYVVTALSVVALNLLEGIMVGFGLALLKQLWVLSRLEVVRALDPESDRHHVALVGAGTFLAIPNLMKAMADVPAGSKVVLDLQRLRHVDQAFIEALRGWEAEHDGAGGEADIDWNSLGLLYAAGRPSAPKTGTEPLEPSAI